MLLEEDRIKSKLFPAYSYYLYYGNHPQNKKKKTKLKQTNQTNKKVNTKHREHDFDGESNTIIYLFQFKGNALSKCLSHNFFPNSTSLA